MALGHAIQRAVRGAAPRLMPAGPSWMVRRPVVAALVLAAAAIVASAILALFPVAQRWAGDVRLFEHYAGQAFSGRLGETPFLSWYPPLALVPLALPLLAGVGWSYAFAFGVEMAAIASAGGLLLNGMREAGRERLRMMLGYGALILAATAVVAWRYDIVPAVLTLAALWSTTRKRWALAGAMLGLATGLKLYAAVLGPLLLLLAWRSGGSQAAIRAAIAGSATSLASVGAYVLFPGSSPMDLLAFTGSRPLHLESTAGSVIAALAGLGVTAADVNFGFGSFNLTGLAADSALVSLHIVQPLVMVASLGAGAYAIRRAPSPELDTVVLAWMAALLGLYISNRVLSPQYLVWVLPLVPLAPGRVQGVLAAAIILGAVIFPWLYASLLQLELLPVALLLLRNGLLIAAWVVVLLHLARRGTSHVDRLQQDHEQIRR